MRLRARRKRQDPRTEKLLQSIATVLINSRCLSAASVQKASGSCLKNVAQLSHRDEHPRYCLICSVPSDRCCVACFHPVCHDCSHETLCTRCVFDVDDKNSCSNASSSLVESDCVSAEVNIVEEEQNMWRRVKKGTKFQVDAGLRSALLLSSQRVKPHFIAESLKTSTVTDALSRTPQEAFLATRVRVRPRDQPEPDVTTEEERRLVARLPQMRTNLGHPDILRITHLQEPYVSLVAAQLQFAQHSRLDAMCARVNNIQDSICPQDLARTQSSVTRQPLTCVCLQIMRGNQLASLSFLSWRALLVLLR